MDTATFGRRVRLYRLRRGYSQERLAEMIGRADAADISKIEAGKKDVFLSTALRIADALGVSLGRLAPRKRATPAA